MHQSMRQLTAAQQARRERKIARRASRTAGRSVPDVPRVSVAEWFTRMHERMGRAVEEMKLRTMFAPKCLTCLGKLRRAERKDVRRCQTCGREYRPGASGLEAA